jgi:hypothetical protein
LINNPVATNQRALKLLNAKPARASAYVHRVRTSPIRPINQVQYEVPAQKRDSQGSITGLMQV